jgi:DNA end-binding protein Ku
MTPIKQAYICPVDDARIDRDNTVKGVEVTKGNYATIEEPDEILADDGIELVAVPSTDLDQATVPGSTMYYLSPSTTSLKAWEILFRLAKDKKRTMIGQTAIRKNSRKMYRLVIFNDFLVLQELVFPEHIRQAPDIVHPTVEKKLMDEAKRVLNATEIPWDKFDADDEGLKRFRERLEGAVPVTSEAKPEDSGNVVDLMDALRQSVAATKKKKGA